jgi:hypothetical protein
VSGDVADSIRTGMQNGSALFAGTTSIKVQKWDDFLDEEIPEVPSLIGDRLIVPMGRVIIYGSPGQYKSFAALQLCLALAQGEDWLGYETHASIRTLYLQAELVPKMMQDRGRGMRIEKVPNLMYGYTADFSLRSPEAWQALADSIMENEIDFVVLDPLSQLLPGSEVDDNVMRTFMQSLDIIRTHCNCGIGLIHHSRKSVAQADGSTYYAGAQDLRGWSGIEAWADAVIRLRRLRNLAGIIELVWEKVRYGPGAGSRWLRFSEEYGILKVAEADPEVIISKFLSDGPRRIKDIDELLKSEAGMSPRRAMTYRQELEAANKAEQYRDPVNKKIQMLRLK